MLSKLARPSWLRSGGLALALLFLLACQPIRDLRLGANMPATANTPTPLTFLALGDSYTIGEGVAETERWPVQLVTHLRAQGWPVADPQIIARTGWTTGELQVAIGQSQPQGPFDLVTLLIGVNNQYRRLSPVAYRTEFAALLEQAITLAGGEAGRVIVLSIPDWGVTPFAAGRNRAEIAGEINHFNSINRTLAEGADVCYVDVTPTSRQAAADPSLVVTDQLHPSGKQYTAWVELVLPEAVAILRRSKR
jgi:lysophospholipase L1-like esterase